MWCYPRVAIHDQIPLDDAVPRVVPEEDGPPGVARAASDTHEDIVADRPAGRVHHVDAADVVAVEVARGVGGVVLEPLGAVVHEEAVFDEAVPRPGRLAS